MKVYERELDGTEGAVAYWLVFDGWAIPWMKVGRWGGIRTGSTHPQLERDPRTRKRWKVIL